MQYVSISETAEVLQKSMFIDLVSNGDCVCAISNRFIRSDDDCFNVAVYFAGVELPMESMSQALMDVTETIKTERREIALYRCPSVITNNANDVLYLTLALHLLLIEGKNPTLYSVRHLIV